MAKYRDRKSLGNSAIAPFREGEAPLDRHARRKEANRPAIAIVGSWAASRGIRFAVTNGQHHWQFRFGKRKADWWPSSAKLVFNQNFASGIHCHDWRQAVAEIARRWNLEGLE